MHSSCARPFLPLSISLLIALSTSECAQRITTATTAQLCRVGPLADTTVIIEGHAAYVEPQTFVSEGDRVLLAGTPMFVWETRGRIGLVEGDSTIGAVLDATGNARPLASPIAARLVNDVRAAATGSGSWAVMFAEAEPVQPPAMPRVVAYWFGITDGARWNSVNRIAIGDGAPRSISASSLVKVGQGYALAVPINREDRRDVLVVEWTSTELRSHIVATKMAGYLALAATSAGDLVLGVVRPDTTEREDENSLFVYQRSANSNSWRALPRLVRGLGQPVRDPSIDLNDGVVVTWSSSSVTGEPNARALVARSLAGELPSPLILAGGVDQVFETSRESQPVWIISLRPTSASGSRLRIVVRSADGVSQVSDLPNPFHRPFAGAWLGSRRLLLTSGVAGGSPTEPPVTSRVLSIDFRCGAAP